MNIPLTRLIAHPDNANRMADDVFATLKSHIETSERYPPVIVRPDPVHTNQYQIIDGHHRVQVLRELGHEHADCVVWDVDDAQTDLLLLTLNRLCGEDDPYRRAALAARLAAQQDDLAQLAKKLPETQQQLKAMLALRDPPAAPVSPPKCDDLPQAMTFFFTADQRRSVRRRLREIDHDPSRALLIALNTGSDH